MESIKTVALAGATGALGEPVLNELLKANLTVTVLTRPTSTSTFPSSVKVAKVDYSDVQSLTAALKGHDAVISTVASAAIVQQENLVNAAIAAGVKRLIPSEFGCDLSNPRARQLPVYGEKVQIEEYIMEKCKGTETTYTFVFNNAFLDWGIDHRLLIDVKGKKIELADGGNNTFTSTPLQFVGRGVAAVLQHPDETANRNVRLHGTGLTQKKLLEIAQRFVGKEGWQITETTTADLEKESFANLKNDPSNVMGWIIGFLKRAIYTQGFGGDFSKNNDNKILGLAEMSEKEVEDVIRSRA